jgi:ferredoxin
MPRRFEVVEADCIGCGLCSERAPENLEIPAGASTAQVFKQPETSAEEQDCLEAGDYCPMGALQGAADFIPVGDSTPAGITPITLES